MRFQAFIFDLDGVILDSFREGIRRIRMICSVHEIPFDRTVRLRLTAAWGMPGEALLHQGLNLSSKVFAKELYKEWERIDQNDPPQLVPGARETLIWLRQNDFKCALLTSRNKKNTRNVLKRHDLLREFALVTTGEDVHHRKPDPRAMSPILEMLEDWKSIKAPECAFVGDTLTDVKCGVAAGLRTLVVQTGPFLLRHVKNANELPIPIGNVLGSIEELPGWVEENFDGTLKILS